MLLGSSGAGTIYSARHEELPGTRAVVKVLRRELAASPKAVERFRAGACAINAIDHPRVVKILDVGRLDTGEPWLMMELLVGSDLRTLVESGGPLPFPHVLSILAQACDGLDAAHRRGIVHRNLGPQRLFILDPGCDVKVVDFGISHEDEVDLARSGRRHSSHGVGSFAFMAPEQAAGATVDRRADIFAMGAIAFWMLTGAPPFGGEQSSARPDVVVRDRAPDARDRRADVPASWAIAIAHALAADPARRPATAHALARSLLELPGADEVMRRVAPAVLREATEATTIKQQPASAH